MRYERISFIVEAEPYELQKGMEDGFELWTNVVIYSWVYAQNLVKITRENGTVVCPYIDTRRGRSFIEEGDYVITEDDGTRHICSKEKFYGRFREISEKTE